MKRIDNATATVDDLFTDGNPGTGTPATIVDAEWLNVLQEEVAEVIEQASISLDQTGADTTQLYDAVIALIAAAAISAASNAEAFAGSITDKSIVPGNFGDNDFTAAGGYQKLPGGLILQWGHKDVSSGSLSYTTSVTFPIAFPTKCIWIDSISDDDAGTQTSTEDDLQTITAKSTTGADFSFIDQNSAAPFGYNLAWFAIGH